MSERKQWKRTFVHLICKMHVWYESIGNSNPETDRKPHKALITSGMIVSWVTADLFTTLFRLAKIYIYRRKIGKVDSFSPYFMYMIFPVRWPRLRLRFDRASLWRVLMVVRLCSDGVARGVLKRREGISLLLWLRLVNRWSLLLPVPAISRK